LEEDSDDTEVLKCMVDDETEMKTIQLLMNWRQRTQANTASSSSRRPKKKKRFIRRDREAAHELSIESTSPKTTCTTKPTFVVGFECEDTYSPA